MSTTDDTVAAMLDEMCVTFTAEYRGERRKALGGDSPMDEWLCVFTHDARPNEPEEFAFFTGLGHRKPNSSKFAQASARSLAKVSKRMLAWEEHYKHWPDVTVAPTPASVLHSLLMDAEAAGQSFHDWCSDYGYDEDSRKALATYEACQQSGDKLRKILSSEQQAKLREALQDY